MLTLSRRVGEWIVITLPDGRDVRVQVSRIQHGKVRLAFLADSSIPIHREEVVEEIRAANRAYRQPGAGERPPHRDGAA